MLGSLLKSVSIREEYSGADSVMVITDTIPVNRKRRAIEGGIRRALAAMLPPNVPYRLLHHSSRSHYGLQVADYCCWAIYRKWQRDEMEWFQKIRPAVRSELNIFGAEIG